MKRILIGGLLALGGLLCSHMSATADCFHVYKPCIRLPVPAIPLYCPSFKFFCESCNWKNCPCPSGPWYSQFPGAAPGAQFGYAAPAYVGQGASVYGGYWGNPTQATPAAAYSGYGAPQWNNGYQPYAPQWQPNYGPYYTAAPHAWPQP